MRRSLLAALVLLLLAPAAAQAQRLTVYSSLPLQGASAPQSRAIVRGIDLALERAGGQAAGRPVRHVSLDDSRRRAGTWTPERVAANAVRAARDDSSIAYIGEFNSGASAVSMPILNEAGILQVSPSNTAIGLTRGGIGAQPGDPDRYYPTGDRHYGRLAPNDRVQARAAATLVRDLGVRRLYVVHDGEVYGRGLARLAARAARGRGIEVVRLRRLGGRNAGSIAREARRRRADGVFYGGITANGAVRLWRALARVRRLRALVGGDGVAEHGFTSRIPRRAARRTRLTISTLHPDAYPPSGREVLDALGPRTDPYALYGYEAMAVVLDAIARGGPARQAVVDAFFATRDRDSVLGRYSIDGFGDTTETRFGVYRVRRGVLVWERVVDAAAP
jgi:branched-chain amino acid transport system substrate-binding protein